MATRKKSHTKRGQAPWNREPPAGTKHHTLSPKRKSAAKARARRAGRPYPNLVDNMRAAKKGKTKTKPKPKRKSTRRA